jgi:hypothetical protein
VSLDHPDHPRLSALNPSVHATDDAYKKTDGLHPIPSILDLPSLHELEGPDSLSSSSTRSLPSSLRNRTNGATEDPLEKVRSAKKSAAAEEYAGAKQASGHRHDGGDGVRRDADVLTKVFVVSLEGSLGVFLVRDGADLVSFRFAVRGYRMDRIDCYALDVYQGWALRLISNRSKIILPEQFLYSLCCTSLVILSRYCAPLYHSPCGAML